MKLIWYILLSLFCGILLAYYFAMYADPEMYLYAKTLPAKHKQASMYNENKIIFIGGSSCAHSIKPDLFIKENLPCVNMGYHAGAGAPFITVNGLSVAKPGDTIIYAMEPRLLQNNESISRVGLVGALALGNPFLANGGFLAERKLSFFDIIIHLRPGAWRLTKSLFISVFNINVHKYTYTDEHFWMTNTRSIAEPADSFGDYDGLNKKQLALIERFVDRCNKQDIKVIAAIPWRLCRMNDVPTSLEWDQDYAAELSYYLPVLMEKRSAVITDKRLFSDTYYHLNRCGAQERTKLYIDSLHEGNVMINGSCKQMKIIE